MASYSPTEKHRRSPHGGVPSPIPMESFTSHSSTVYSVDRTIGRGGYGVVYAVYDRNMNYYALKTSRSTSIALETAVMKEAENRKCKHFAKLHDEGWADVLKLSFLVMDLLGPSLSELKNICDGQIFGMGTIIRVAMQTLNAIEELHECGFISRDVKPSNFVSSATISKRSLIYMIDFGISKRFKDLLTDMIYAAKVKCSFRGTARFCSLRNHLREVSFSKVQVLYNLLGLKDDVESWIYMCSEFANSKLPWAKLTRVQRNEIHQMKISVRKDLKETFIGKLPSDFSTIMDMNDALTFESKPDYGSIYTMLDKEYQKLGIPYTEPYDWEYLTLFSRTGRSPGSGPSKSNTPTSFNLSDVSRENEVVETQEETDK